MGASILANLHFLVGGSSQAVLGFFGLSLSRPLVPEHSSGLCRGRKGAADFLANFREFNRPLAGKVKVILLDGRSPRVPIRRLVCWVVQRYGLSRRDEVTTYSFASAAGLVVGTDRIATVHSRLARLAARYQPIAIHVPPLAFPEMKQAMQWHKYRWKDPGLSWLRNVFQTAVADMDAAAGLPATAS